MTKSFTSRKAQRDLLTRILEIPLVVISKEAWSQVAMDAIAPCPPPMEARGDLTF